MICGRRALPIYWVLLDKKGSRDFGEQKKFLKPVLRLLKPYPLVVMGDRVWNVNYPAKNDHYVGELDSRQLERDRAVFFRKLS
jgi:hypothetical protein